MDRLTIDKDSKTIQWENNNLFKRDAEVPDFHMQKKKAAHKSHTIY